MECKQITLRIDGAIYEALENESARKRITKAELINIILYQYFQSKETGYIRSHDR